MSQAEAAQYHSLQEVIYDTSLPNFDPGTHMARTPTTPSTLLGSYPSTPHYNDHFKQQSLTVDPDELPKIRRKHPFSSSLEPPQCRIIAGHVLACLIGYSLIIATAHVANHIPLFWSRFIVGLSCGITGFFTGYSILKLGRLHLEAAAWATVIHRSRTRGSSGIKLRDLAAFTEDSTSAWSALRLLWNRVTYTETSSLRRHRRCISVWTLVVLFFLVLFLTAASSPFILGRLVRIRITTIHQTKDYDEVVVAGANSDADIQRAAELNPTFSNFALTWTIESISTHGKLPPVVSFEYDNDTIYFSETTLSQLMPNGSGFGAFLSDTQNVSFDRSQGDATGMQDTGSILRFPRWGTRLHCAKIPEPKQNIVARSPAGFTYVYTPRPVMRALFSSFDMEYPSLEPLNTSSFLQLNDTLPTSINPDEITFGAAYPDNGAGHSLFSQPVSLGHDGNGWVTIEQVLVRLNTTYTPNGTFPLKSELSVPDALGNPTWIGYDAAVCVQLFEPWILEVANSTSGLPRTLRIVEAGSEVQSVETDRHSENMLGFPMIYPGVSRQLNSSKLVDVYTAAHTNSVNQIVKDNGRDSFYVPSPTVVSFTNGHGPLGYTELSEETFARARGLADANNLLPYFAGSGKILARRYYDSLPTSASVNPVHLGIYFSIVLAIGILAGMSVPKLPLDIPHRGFEVYSWIAAFHGDELIGMGNNTGITRNMELDEIAKRFGENRFRFTIH